MPLPNPSFQPKTHQWRPGARAPSREVPSQNCAFCARKQRFLAQNGPEPIQNDKTKVNSSTPQVRLDLPMTKSPLLRSNSTIYPRKAKKWPKMAQLARSLCQTAPKTRTGRILGYVAQQHIPRAPSPPANPHFWWCPTLRIAQRDA